MKHSLEYTIIRLMLLVRRVGAKMGGSLWLLQRILSSLLPADDIDVADEPVHLSDGITDADLAPLLAMLPGKKRYGSCLRDNDLSHKDDYDLEIIIPAYNVEQYIDYSLHSPSVNHHVFAIFCRLLRQYYEGYTTSDPHLQPLEHALLTKDYRACMLAVMTRH